MRQNKLVAFCKLHRYQPCSTEAVSFWLSQSELCNSTYRTITSIATSLLHVAFEPDSFQARSTSISRTFLQPSLTLTQCWEIGRPKMRARKSSSSERFERSDM